MTEKQYQQYQKIENELKPIKLFLSWCGVKYHDKFCGKYAFYMKKHQRRFFTLHGERDFGELVTIPKDLQAMIIEVIENYVEEKEKELESI